MTGIYDSDMSFFDGLTRGIRYEMKEAENDKYIIYENDLGGISTLSRDKFIDVKDDLLVAAEKAVKEENMTVGFYGGKFLPLHLGHLRMISESAKMVDKLYVILSSSPLRDEELCERDKCKPMPAYLRLSWIGEMVNDLDNVEIMHVLDNQSEEDYDWEEGANNIKAAIPETITHIFSSEPEYSKYFDAYYPGAEHIVIDSERSIVPISATEIRKDVYKHWNMLPPPVRAHFTKKVAIVGTESCGKSTLTKLLASHYNTEFVPEYGRFYCEKYSNQLNYKMFSSIAMDHYLAVENKLPDSNKLLFIDSEALTTRYYLGMYMKTYSIPNDIIDGIIEAQEFDLVLYLEPDVEWVDDGIRFAGEQKVREENNKHLKDMFGRYGIECIMISGDYDKRFEKARELVDNLME